VKPCQTTSASRRIHSALDRALDMDDGGSAGTRSG
jgi:hypothetical protein